MTLLLYQCMHSNCGTFIRHSQEQAEEILAGIGDEAHKALAPNWEVTGSC